jgi:hypothetical protein
MQFMAWQCTKTRETNRAMNDAQQTPVQEAISIITIAAFLVAVGCYVAATANVPIASPALFWVASLVLSLVSCLERSQGAANPHVGQCRIGGMWLLFGGDPLRRRLGCLVFTINFAASNTITLPLRSG